MEYIPKVPIIRPNTTYKYGTI